MNNFKALLTYLFLLFFLTLTSQVILAQLNFIESYRDDECIPRSACIYGLEQVRDGTISPDGKHLYCSSIFDRSIAIFERESSGRLTFIETIEDQGIDVNGNTIIGLNGTRDITISKDGKNIYVVNNSDNAIVVFERNIETGLLAFIEIIEDGNIDEVTGQVIDIAKPQTVSISPDDKFVYVFKNQFITSAKIIVFKRDQISGELSFVEAVNVIAAFLGDIREMTISRDNQFLYAAIDGDNAISIYIRDIDSGKLTFLKSIKNGELDTEGNLIDGLDGCAGISVSSDNTRLYAVGRRDNGLAVFERNIETGDLTFLEVLKQGMLDNFGNTVQGLSSARNIEITSDNSTLYVRSPTEGIGVFQKDSTSRRLAFVEVIKNQTPDTDGNLVEGISDIRSVILSPDDNNVYATSIDDNAIASFKVNESRRLTYLETQFEGDNLSNGVVINGLATPRTIAIANNDKHLYVTALLDNSITLFNRNVQTGQLRYVQTLVDGSSDSLGNSIEFLERANGIGISPDNNFVYVSSAQETAVNIFARDQDTGKLTFSEDLKGIPSNFPLDINFALTGASKIFISPDGKIFYLLSDFIGKLAVFKRDSITGSLSFSQLLVPGVSDPNGTIVRAVEIASGIDVSNDSRFVYTTSYSENAIGIFERDLETDTVTFLQSVRDQDVDGNGTLITGLRGVLDVSLSPDENFLYAVGSFGTGSGSFVVFERNKETSELTFVESLIGDSNQYSFDVNVLPELFDASKVEVTENRVYVDVRTAILVFERDVQTGKVALLERQSKFNTFTDETVISQDCKFLYTLSDDVDAISIYQETNPTIKPPNINSLTFDICNHPITLDFTPIDNAIGYIIEVRYTFRGKERKITRAIDMPPLSLNARLPVQAMGDTATIRLAARFVDENTGEETVGVFSEQKEFLIECPDKILVEERSHPEPVTVIAVSPNPVNDVLKVSYTNLENSSTEATWSIFHASGRLIKQQKFEINKDQNELLIPTNHLPSGIYYLKLDIQGVNEIEPFTKL